MTKEESADVILGYVEDEAKKIIETYKDSIDDYSETCKRALDSTLDSIKDAAKDFDTLAPFNLFELLASGGFIRSKKVEVEYDRTSLNIELGNMNILHEPYQHNYLDKGFYRVTVIVEPLEKEAGS